MKITKRSQLTGAMHTMTIPCTEQQFSDWETGMLIQNAMPNISPEHREFLMTGITPDEWDLYVKGEDEE